MELREYYLLVKKHKRLFFGVFICILGGAIFWGFFRPLRYSSNLGIHIARTIQVKNEKQDQYDSFYRLQADERFADTIVRWLASPRIVLDVFEKAGVSSSDMTGNELEKIFRSRRLSSQFIETTYKTVQKEDSLKLSQAVVRVLNEKTRSLNNSNDTERWFSVLVDEPVIEQDVVNWRIVLGAAVLLGLFSGFFVVLGRHYFLMDGPQ